MQTHAYYYSELQDLLHPLTTFVWKDGTDRDLPGDILYTQAVLLQDFIYVGIALWQLPHGFVPNKAVKAAKLYAISTDLTTWEALDTPDVENFALTTFHSQLVIVGGSSVSTKKALNNLWTSSKGTKWKQTLPPMPTSRSESTAFNTGNFSAGKPEYLVVAGGVGKMNEPVGVVEVLVDNCWKSVCSLPKPCFSVRVAFHYGIVYLIGGPGSFHCEVFCKLESLIATCAETSIGRSNYIQLWKPFHSQHRVYSPVSFGDKLIEVGRREDCKILAYSPMSQSWIHVGDLPVNLSATTALITPANELAVVGRRTDVVKFIVLKASLKSEY